MKNSNFAHELPNECRAKKSQPSGSRKWQLVINNPQEKEEYAKFWKDENLLREYIKDNFPTLDYACFSYEIGLEENHMEHIHIFLYAKDGIKKSKFKTVFPNVHYDACKGSCLQNKNYLFKQGKWELDEKVKERIDGKQFEIGECPIERQGARTDLELLQKLILMGYTNAQIYDAKPTLMKYAGSIDRIRQDIMRDKFKDTWRDLDVTYIWGASGAGKTRGVMEKYGYANVYGVNSYEHPFDDYNMQDVIAFEEFRSDIKISTMLQLLDGYPCNLDARYNNKQACFTKAYFMTNVDLWEQYKHVQENEWETFVAFVRRIHKVVVYEDRDNIKEYAIVDYIFDCSNYDIKKKLELIKAVDPKSTYITDWELDEKQNCLVPKMHEVTSNSNKQKQEQLEGQMDIFDFPEYLPPSA